MKRFQNKVSLVTGGNRGIGRAIALRLASEGSSIILFGRNEKDNQSVEKEITDTIGVPMKSYVVDISSKKSVEEGVKAAISHFHRIDVLINNAGIFSFQEITRTDPKKIETMLQLHIGTVTRLSRLFATDMCNRKHGYILNMSSLSCWTPYPGIALYTATKAYIRVFTRALGYELRDYGVVATVVCPGGVATGLYGLKPGLLKLGVRLGVLMTTERLVRKALKALFQGKKQLIPGVFNRLLIPLASVMPTSIRLFVKHRLLDE